MFGNHVGIRDANDIFNTVNQASNEINFAQENPEVFCQQYPALCSEGFQDSDSKEPNLEPDLNKLFEKYKDTFPCEANDISGLIQCAEEYNKCKTALNNIVRTISTDPSCGCQSSQIQFGGSATIEVPEGLTGLCELEIIPSIILSDQCNDYSGDPGDDDSAGEYLLNVISNCD